MDNEIKESSMQELAVAFSAPALASNRFFVVKGPTVRIAFCEELSGIISPQFRVAVSLPLQDAIALMKVLQYVLKDDAENKSLQ